MLFVPSAVTRAAKCASRPAFVRITHLASALALIVAAGGCAVTHDNRGAVRLGIDTAEVFGTTIERFTLADGGEGTLRRGVKNDYSIKLQRYQRVLPLQPAVSARVAHVTAIGNRTSILIELQERNCKYRYSLFSIEGSDVSNWVFGNCSDRPRVAMEDGEQVIDFPNGKRLSRYRLVGAQVLHGTITPPPDYGPFTRPFADADLRAPSSTAASGAATAPTISADGRHIPPPPIPIETRTSQVAGRQDTPLPQNRNKPGKQAQLPTQRELVFHEEVRPTRVVDLR